MLIYLDFILNSFPFICISLTKKMVFKKYSFVLFFSFHDDKDKLLPGTSVQISWKKWAIAKHYRFQLGFVSSDGIQLCEGFLLVMASLKSIIAEKNVIYPLQYGRTKFLCSSIICISYT